VEFPSLDFACIGALFSGDCDSVNSFQANGTIAAGDSQNCSIQNIIQVADEPERGVEYSHCKYLSRNP